MSLPLTNIKTLKLSDIDTLISSLNLPEFRSKQLWEWIWKKQITSFEQISNLPKNLIQHLKSNYSIHKIEIVEETLSIDKSIKFVFKTYDNLIIEGVLIWTKNRITACISSQAGCSLSCTFCATGQLKMKRNLLPYEIFDQVEIIKEKAQSIYKQNISNIVYMGMGEPLLNYKNVLSSISLICNETSHAFSQKRITVSTAGICKIIKQLADNSLKINLAISLHSADNSKRSEIMAINKTNSLDMLSESLQYFYTKTLQRITLEYIIFKDFNDRISDAKKLADFAKAFPCKINIIEYNPIETTDFQKAEDSVSKEFIDYLKNKRLLPVTIRKSKGQDINAACGQLASKVELFLK